MDADEEGFDGQQLGNSLSACKDAEFIRYDEEVEKAIQEVCPSAGPLDNPEFNVVEYINKLFPTEQSLSSIDETVLRYRSRLGELDREIRDIIRRQSDTGYSGKHALEDAQKTIEILFARIKNIREKAERTEQTVQEITQGIKRLDTAKQNLTISIKTLQQLKITVTSLKDLEKSTSERDYSLAADQLRVVLNIMDSFEKYQHIEKMQELSGKVSTIKEQLATQIKEDFQKAFTTGGAGPRMKSNLAAACSVVDALEKNIKEDLIRWFINLQMSHYRADFDFTQEHAWLDKIDRRYAWLKRTLVIYQEDCGKIFPIEWGVPERLCLEFCDLTKTQLRQQMGARPGDIEVKLLLYAIQKTTTFEKALAHKYATSSYLETITPISPPRRSTSDNLEMEVPTESATRKEENSLFIGRITRCFEDHLGVYIESQEKNLADLMDQFVKDFHKQCVSESSSRDEPISSLVLPSSADLFVFYKKCLVQCISLSTGEALLQLTQLFQKYLEKFADRVLAANIPKVSQSGGSSGATGRLNLNFLRGDDSAVPEAKLTKSELVIMCTIICTADYCVDTTHQLENKLKEKIDEKYCDTVSFLEQSDKFQTVISNCIHLWVQFGVSVCDGALNSMVKYPWSSVTGVGDHSQYVTTIKRHLAGTVPVLRENLTSCRKYFINFCNRFADTFIPSFISHLYKCRQVTTYAAEQLLLDTSILKKMLLELPSMGQAIQRKAPGSYSKIVQKGMDRAELILKIVMAPHNMADAFVSNYMILMKADAEVASFQRILEMKGLKRSEQTVLLDLFKTRSSQGLAHQNAAAKEEDQADVSLSGSKLRKITLPFTKIGGPKS